MLPIDSPDSAARPVVIFRLADLVCAFEAKSILQLIHLPAVVAIAGRTSLVYGFVNLRGKAVPVVNGRKLFSLRPVDPGVHSPLIVLEPGGRVMALLVDSIEDVSAVRADELQAVEPGESLNGCSEAQFLWNGEGVTMLSAERLLTAKEQMALADLTASTERRLQELLQADTA